MAQKRPQRPAPRKTNDDLIRENRNYASRGRYQNKRRNNAQTLTAVIVVLLCIVVVTGVVIGCLHIYKKNQSTTFPTGFTISGVDVGGLTQEEAINAILKATQSTYSLQKMVVTVEKDTIEIAPEVSGVALDAEAAVKAAFKDAKAYTAFDVTPYLNLDEAAIRNELNKLGEKYTSLLSQSTYTIRGEKPNQEIVVTLGTPEYGLDMNALYKSVLDAFNANTFTASATCGIIEPDPIDLEAIHTEHYIAPVDAYWDETTGAIVPGVDGYGFDLEAAKAKLKNATYGSTVVILFTDIPPSVTADKVPTPEKEEQLATYTGSEIDSSEDRNTNLRLACEAINGLVIQPGETFSYNDALGERTEERGYKPGPSIANGKIVDTIGGGICQVSSILYYCVMMADLEIVDRDNHGYAVSYVPLGMDAAVSWGTLDFRFKNNTSEPIRIEASSNGGSVTVSLYGKNTKDHTIKLRYEIEEIISSNRVVQEYPENNPQNYKDGDVIQEGHTGYKVTTYRGRYDKQGNLLEEVKEAYSEYKASDKIVCKIIKDTTDPDPLPGLGNGNVMPV